MNSTQTGITPMTGADLLVDSLIGHGIETLFGLPGDTGVNFYDALSRRPDALVHVLARDERHAGYMADGYARTSGRIAVCEASSGAGAVYLASGLAESYASSIPMLVVTTDIHRSSRGSNAITEIDQEALFSAVTKWCRTAQRADEIPELVAEAIRQATSGRPAPTALVFPEDVLDELATTAASTGSSHFPRERRQAEPAAVDEAASILSSATRPVVLAGGGIHTSQANPALRRFAEHTGIPVATTIHGKGAMPEDHPLSLGVNGGNGSRGYANLHLAASDAVLIVGSRANSTDTDGFTSPRRDGGRAIQIEVDGARAGRNFAGSIRLVGDARTVLEQLTERVPTASREQAKRRTDEIAEARRAWAATTSAAPVTLPEEQLHPREVVQVLHRVLGADCWVAADPGTPTPNLSAYWEADGHGWRVVIPRGHGPMGYSISAAIGISVAHPHERVLCLTTEGSLAMGIGDWETAARLNLPITFVVLDNTSYAWIKMLQHLFMERRYFQVDPGPIDPVLLARGMGLAAERAATLDDLEILVKNSAASDGPSVIHVRVPEHKDVPPPVSPWQTALADPTAGRPVY